MTVSRLDSSTARANWHKILDAAQTGTETVIERCGKPTAVLLPWADYEALTEELDDLRAARRAAAAYEAWKRNPNLGQGWHEIKDEWAQERLIE